MKYKKKKIEKNKYADDRYCVDEATYSQFSTAAALIEAQQQADRRFAGVTRSSGRCTWSTRVEVRNAKYETYTANNTFGLQPLPRCMTVNSPGDGVSFDIIKSCKNGNSQEVNEYIPGGSQPPCQNGAEGACVVIDQQKSWSQGSSWKLDPSQPPAETTITLSYDFRIVPNSVIRRPSGATCTRPAPDPWQTKAGSGLTSCTRCKAKITTESRCYDVTTNYDCCCNCNPVEVPDVAYCTSPNYDQSRNSAVQQAYALLALGMCSAAIGVTAPLWGIAAGAGCVIVGTTMLYGACANP